ncbi:DNA cytosine methyltransferase [Spiroplasma clarkii]|uniref:DNA cytosine methyltransferase n=1 Tax=Spiroplasma clarkii TaxID=2139 RepID=UPI000C20FDB3|nr:DNA cytosine methyltransferase [Spiroplasma clarkii]
MKKETYISLFSSAGVGCYGFKQAGFECVATNELLSRRLEVQKHNSKCKYDSGYILGDVLQDEVKNKIFDEIRLWHEKEGIEEITTIIATPPCQGMSVANHKKKDEQKRNSLVVESIKLIKQIKPKTFVLENVRSFLNTICTDIDGKEKRISEAILNNLEAIYNIESRVLNFKDYGSNSSRTRTLVLGVRRDVGLKLNNLFPTLKNEKMLGEIIGKLPHLVEMGQIDETDIYHSFRHYKGDMRNWIKKLKQGQSAFDNTDISKLPHYYKNGLKILTKNGNSDKYKRQCFDKVAPCIHTRNDIMASQNTIHPVDDRVFSVRELMLMMTIPSDFKWVAQDEKELNEMSLENKRLFIKQNDVNIRQSIGEAVPTAIFFQIASNILMQLEGLNEKRYKTIFTKI